MIGSEFFLYKSREENVVLKMDVHSQFIIQFFKPYIETAPAVTGFVWCLITLGKSGNLFEGPTSSVMLNEHALNWTYWFRLLIIQNPWKENLLFSSHVI